MPDDYKIIGGDGREYGPLPLEGIRDWIAEGRVGHDTLVWKADEGRWLKASERHELKWDLPRPEDQPLAQEKTETLIPAGFWIRLAAYGVDFFIVNAISSLVTMPYGPQLKMAMDRIQQLAPASDLEPLLEAYRQAMPVMLITVGLYSIVSLAYYVGFNGRFGGTPGKWLLGLRIVTSDGQPIGFGLAFKRYAAELVSLLIFGIGYLMILWNSEQRALHDLIAGTRVIRRPMF